MLDYDMLSSPNYVRFVYDGDGNAEAGNPPGPEGSGKVEQVFDDWFRAQGLASDARAVRRPLRLRRLHRPWHPGRRRVRRRRGAEDARAGSGLRRRRRLVVDPCYHQFCDNLITVLTGVPPLDAEGLAPDGDDAAKHAAQRKMAGGAIKSLTELSGAASYAVYYFAASKDPFGTKPHKHDSSRRGHKWHGHTHRINR